MGDGAKDSMGPAKTTIVLGEERPPARADAVRNRALLLDAAARIVAEEGADALTMYAVAGAAGVGVGTVYRRFGDRAGLVYALVDHRERELQAALLSGPPPLGPGAPPARRIRAFLHAYVDRLEEQGALLALAEAEAPTARFTNGAYATQHRHVRVLVALAAPELDADYTAEILLAPLAAGLHLYLREQRDLPVARIKRGLDHLVDALLPEAAGDRSRAHAQRNVDGGSPTG